MESSFSFDIALLQHVRLAQVSFLRYKLSKTKLTYSNHFYSKYFHRGKRAMFVHRVHSRTGSIASIPNAISYRWRINRSDPVEHAKEKNEKVKMREECKVRGESDEINFLQSLI